MRFNPSWVRSWPIARLATSGLSLLTIAKRPGRPNRSSAFICDKGVWSGVWAGPGDSLESTGYPCCNRAFCCWACEDDCWDAIGESWKFCKREFKLWPCWFALPVDIGCKKRVRKVCGWKRGPVLHFCQARNLPVEVDAMSRQWIALSWLQRVHQLHKQLLDQKTFYAPPNPTSLGEKFLPTSTVDLPVSAWLLGILVIPCRVCNELGAETKAFVFENPPKAAFCIKLPLESCPDSSLPFLPSGGNSSMLPVCGWLDPDNWPIPPWPPWRYSSIPLENREVGEKRSSAVDCDASWDCWFCCGASWAVAWELSGCCCWGRWTGVCWTARWLAFAHMAWLWFENCVWGAPESEGNSLKLSVLVVHPLFFPNEIFF